MSLTSIRMNRRCRKNDGIRDAEQTTPENVVRYDGISYGPHGKWNRLDVYRPKDSEGFLPVIVNVHGGGWVYGTKETYQFYCMSLAQQGFAVVNFNYRLAPRHKFPAGMEDTNRVFHWVFETAHEYGFDTSRIFAVGDSAGAHMLSLYAAICTNPHYAKTYPFHVPADLQFMGIALNCGIYAVKKGVSRELDALMGDLMPHRGTEKEMHHISPAEHITSAFPPAIVMAAEGDRTVPPPDLLLAVLKEKQVHHRFDYYGDPEHPLKHVFHCDMRLSEAARCNKDQCDWFKSFL